MPTYQYVCTNAEGKHEFEVVQSFTDPAVATCPECDAPVRKVFGSVGVVFKGSGFYRTDSRKSESSTAPAAAKEPAAAGKDSSPATKTASTSTPSASAGTSSKAAD